VNDIEQKALALVRKEDGHGYLNYDAALAALCRAIEQHEAFKQEVSDVAAMMLTEPSIKPSVQWALTKFIIPQPKPDPLVEAMTAAFGEGYEQLEADNLRAMLDARGWEIREKGQ
jgi:hypothetical protein